jgi:hypothetical protein
MRFSEEQKELAMDLWRVVNAAKQSIKDDESITEVRSLLQDVPEKLAALCNDVNVVLPDNTVNVDLEEAREDIAKLKLSMDEKIQENKKLLKRVQEFEKRSRKVHVQQVIKRVATHPRKSVGQGERRSVVNRAKRAIGL